MFVISYVDFQRIHDYSFEEIIMFYFHYKEQLYNLLLQLETLISDSPES